jgi:hypothetical protein
MSNKLFKFLTIISLLIICLTLIGCGELSEADQSIVDKIKPQITSIPYPVLHNTYTGKLSDTKESIDIHFIGYDSYSGKRTLNITTAINDGVSVTSGYYPLILTNSNGITLITENDINNLSTWHWDINRQPNQFNGSDYSIKVKNE